MNTFYPLTDILRPLLKIKNKNKELNRGAVRVSVAKKGAVTETFLIKIQPSLKNCHFCC